jgi:hypothetical protein
MSNRGATIRAGVLGGLLGGVVIWIYEAVVWVNVEHLMPLIGIPRNATGLVFGQPLQASLGAMAYVIGTVIHFGFASAWGILFASVWPFFRRQGYEATFIALLYAMFAWIVMHAAIALAGHKHPDYLDAGIIINGLVSHLFFSVPLALVVRRRLAAGEPL